MGLIRSIRDAFAVPPGDPPYRPGVVPDGLRSFVTGPGLVEPSAMHWGIDDSPYAPTEPATYLAKSAVVYRATMLRATLLASLPITLYRGKGDQRKEVTTGPVRDLLDSVNPWWTFDRLMQMTELSLCLFGKCFYFLNRQGGRPRELWWAPPDRVRVVPDPNAYVKQFVFKPTNGGKDIVFSPEETVWIRTPNPMNEFDGLSPISAVAMTADTSIEAIKSNRLIFKNGIQLAALVTPKPGTPNLTTAQATEVSEQMDRRFRGVDKAHRVGTLTFPVDVNTMSMSPKDAEFLGALAWTKEDVALAFGVPLDLIGGQRTYANVEASERIVWSHTVKPEADFIASELTEQLLPMFGATDLVAEFDYSDVAALSENADAIWTRAKDAWLAGGITLNQYMEIIDQDSVKGILGDARILPRGSALIDADGNLIATASGTGDVSALGAPAKPTPQVTDGKAGDGTAKDAAGKGATGDTGKADGQDAGATPKGVADDGAPGGPRARRVRAVAFGSEEHRTLMARAEGRRSPWEARFAETTADLMRRQRQSILKQLRGTERGYHRLATKDLLESILSLPRWIREFRTAIRPVIAGAVDDVGRQSLDDLGLGISFDLADPNVKVAMERQAQRFANEVNATTWDRLRSSLADGLDAGEGIDDLAKRVEAVMGDRIASSAETIARTEALTAASTGTIESWRQSGVVAGKTWLSTLDDRTRDAHAEAHGQTVGIDEDFEVGGDTGPGPGMMGSPENDCNCFVPDTLVEGAFVAGLKAEYAGPVWEVETRRGYRLTVTPNHPVLTDQGWRPAHQLREGMNLFSDERHTRLVSLPNKNEQGRPSRIEDVFDTLGADRRRRMAVLIDLDLHGDAIWTKGKVDVVGPDGVLPFGTHVVGSDEGSGDPEFPSLTGSSTGIAKESDGAAFLARDVVGLSPTGFPRGGQLTLDRVGIASEALPLRPFRVGPAADWDTGFAEKSANSGARVAGFVRELLLTSSGYVTRDEIVRVRELNFSGHVYDLQSKYGWILAQNIIVSNCRCSLTAVLDTDMPKRSRNGNGRVKLIELAKLVGVEAR